MEDMTQHEQGAVIVTGAASGMGLATAREFLARGRHVIGIDLAGADAVPATGDAGSYTPVAADVRSREILAAAVEAALGPAESIDVVANVAGVYPLSTLETYDEAIYRHIFDVNVLGVLNVIAACRPRLTGGAAVVNIASVDAFEVSPGQLLYGASKAAVVMLTKSLALELAPARIRVNGVAPGWIATPGTSATDRMKAAAGGIPLGRVGRPEEVARWIALLADGDLAGFMTGETVVLSGGDVLR